MKAININVPYLDIEEETKGLCIDVFKIDMAWPGLSHVIVLWQVNCLADALDGGDVPLRHLFGFSLRGFKIFNAVAIKFRRTDTDGQRHVPLNGLFFVTAIEKVLIIPQNVRCVLCTCSQYIRTEYR